jgi:periplasmic mercuric ion binding protein
MKTQSFILSFIVFIFGAVAANAQKANAQKNTGLKSESIKVWGECGMCKKTIEKSAKAAGASAADWNTETKVLTVSYNAKATNPNKIQQVVAAAGYDTKDFTANNAAYDNLHECCKYERKESVAATAKDCCKDGKCTHEGASCCKDGKCAKADGTSCCNDATAKDGAACCKDGKCDKKQDCCKEKGCCKS